MDSAKSRRLWFEWCILFTMKELPENKLIKRQVFLQKSQNQFISEVHEAIKIVPHVLISINCLGKFTFGSRSMYWLHVIPSLFAICVLFNPAHLSRRAGFGLPGPPKAIDEKKFSYKLFFYVYKKSQYPQNGGYVR